MALLNQSQKNVDISTKGALKEMIMTMITCYYCSYFVGVFLGPEALGVFTLGSVVVGVFLAIMMANSGGALDNAKIYRERKL